MKKTLALIALCTVGTYVLAEEGTPVAPQVTPAVPAVEAPKAAPGAQAQEWLNSPETIAKFDKDGDGKLTGDELKAAKEDWKQNHPAPAKPQGEGKGKGKGKGKTK